MTRELTGHHVNECNEAILIEVLDEPGNGGACHKYRLTLPSGATTDLSFQDGPIKEVGTNGITHEALLTVLIDRIQHFQRGEWSCRENALALTKLDEARLWLLERTRERDGRGVEGTHRA